MGEIADDCYDRGIDELFDSYDNHDQYEEMRQYFKKPHVPATRAEVLDDFESDEDCLEDDERKTGPMTAQDFIEEWGITGQIEKQHIRMAWAQATENANQRNQNEIQKL